MQVQVNSRIKSQDAGAFRPQKTIERVSPKTASLTPYIKEKEALAVFASPNGVTRSPAQKQGPIPFEDLVLSANERLLLVADPLWRRVCTDVIHMMGPLSAPKLTSCRLGDISCTDKVVDVYCQTEGVSHFLERHAFLILGSLKNYFPTLKEIRIRLEPLN